MGYESDLGATTLFGLVWNILHSTFVGLVCADVVCGVQRRNTSVLDHWPRLIVF